MLRQLTGAKVINLPGYDTCFIQVPTSAKTNLSRTERQDVTYVRAAPRGRALQLPLFLNKDWYSARHASTSLPLVQPFSSNPSKSLLKSFNGATSSPPTTIAGQKQLNPCPMTERAATVERTQFKKSSRNRRASRRNSLCRYWLPTLPNAAITRVPSRNFLSSIGAKREQLGTTYASHCSTRGKDDAFFIFCSRQ